MTSSRTILLAVPDPYGNHNGGHLAFGPNGLLYTSIGDGGSGGDPEDRAQDLRSQFGKLLTLNPSRPAAGWSIAALGLRNPWRFSFDRANGDLYIGDVGQGAIEEISYTPRSSPGLENYGWDLYEGSRRHEEGTAEVGKLVFPVAEYDHGRGCSVTGGFVYRGSARRSERGRYVYGDYCSGIVWSLRIVRRRGEERPRGAVPRREPDLVRRERRRRALRRVGRGDDLPDQLARRRTRGGACPRAAYASAFSDSCRSWSSRATSMKPSWRSVVRFRRSSSSAIRSRRSRRASSWRSPTSCCSTAPILRTLQEVGSRVDDGRVRADVVEQSLERTRTRLERGDAPGRPELGQRGTRELLWRVREDADGRPLANQGLQARARRRVATQVCRRVILAEPLEEDAPVAGARLVERPRRLPAVGGQRVRIDVQHGASRLEPRAPERARVAERVELDRDRALRSSREPPGANRLPEDDPDDDAHGVERHVER